MSDLASLRDFFKWEPPSWYSMGTCWSVPRSTDLLFSGKKKEREAAKTLFCRRCPVSEACLAYAINNEEPDGIWGGYDKDERDRIGQHWIIRTDKSTLSLAVVNAFTK